MSEQIHSNPRMTPNGSVMSLKSLPLLPLMSKKQRAAGALYLKAWRSFIF